MKKESLEKMDVGHYYDVREFKARDPKRVMFFFPAGFTKLWQYRWTFWLLNRQGVSVVGFDQEWHKSVTDFDMDDMVQLIEDINERVKKEIAAREEDTKYTVFGSSFGSVPALYVAKQHGQIDSVILNVGYGELSNVLWHYKRSRPFLERLKAGGLENEAELRKLTEPVETQKDLNKLRGKKVVNFLARKDSIVLDGQKLVDALTIAVPNAIFHETQFGHFFGGIENILHKSKWDEILE